MVSLSFPAAPQNFTLSQETPEDDPKGRQAFQAGWFNDLVTKVSVSFFLSFFLKHLFIYLPAGHLSCNTWDL